jgi:hypothetical protein
MYFAQRKRVGICLVTGNYYADLISNEIDLVDVVILNVMSYIEDSLVCMYCCEKAERPLLLFCTN